MEHPPRTISLHLHPSNTKISATLHAPEEPDQECPILQDPISTAKFDILPRPFDLNHPTHTAITICQCSHTFHAMALVYHWARSGSVQCPVCRAGPKGQRLSIRRLPREWRYSLAARIRRQRRIDQAEAEEEDRQVALRMMMSTPQQATRTVVLPLASMFINIRIEVMSAINMDAQNIPTTPLSWTVTTVPIQITDTIIFDVPSDELRRIPYPMGTSMRLVPCTNSLLRPLRPSTWFVAGVEQCTDTNFSAHCSEAGFQHMHYSMSNAAYDEMAVDIFTAYGVLIAVSE